MEETTQISQGWDLVIVAFEVHMKNLLGGNFVHTLRSSAFGLLKMKIKIS